MASVSRMGPVAGTTHTPATNVAATQAQVARLMGRAERVIADRSTATSSGIKSLADELYAAGSHAEREAVTAMGFEILGPATPSPEVRQMHQRLLSLASVVLREERTPPGWE